MKMLAEYLEKAVEFETMAAQEKDAKLKAALEKQAEVYRKLAEKRAKDYGLKPPNCTTDNRPYARHRCGHSQKSL
jgi:hypothetical protein